MPQRQKTRIRRAQDRAIQILSKNGWKCTKVANSKFPFSIIAAKKGELILVAVEVDMRTIPEQELLARLQWAMRFNAPAEEWYFQPDGRLEKRTIHQPASEVHRDGSEQIGSHRMREVEQKAASFGLSQLLMMENAGRSLADVVNRYLGGVRERRIIAVAGLGNNGGDGMAAARHLSILGGDVTVLLLGEADQIKTDEARINWNILSHMPAVKLENIRRDRLSEAQERIIREADVVIDAIFGTGIKGETREPQRSAIKAINSTRGTVFAVDVPSGLDPDTGSIAGIAVKAHVTISLHLAKPGLLKQPGFVGELWIGSIGVPYALS